MPLIIIVLLAGLFIELLGTVISVAGVAAMTNANLIIIAFVIALDIGKVATISVLYQHWERLSLALKSFGILAALVTIGFSSAGAGGYLSNELKKSLIGPQTQQIEVAALEAQIAKYEDRKRQIDDQIANVPPRTSVTARIRIMNAFKEEQKAVSLKIAEIEARLPALKQEHVLAESAAGPIFTMSKQLGVTVEVAVNIIVGLLILVFNPFAVYLVVLGNFMIKNLKKTEEVVSTVHAPEPIAVPVPPTPAASNEEMPKTHNSVTDIVQSKEENVVSHEPTKEEVVIPEQVPVIEAAPQLITDDVIEEEPEHVTRAEERKREKRISLLLDKALAQIPDGTEISATPLKSTEFYRDL